MCVCVNIYISSQLYLSIIFQNGKSFLKSPFKNIGNKLILSGCLEVIQGKYDIYSGREWENATSHQTLGSAMSTVLDKVLSKSFPALISLISAQLQKSIVPTGLHVNNKKAQSMGLGNLLHTSDVEVN